MNSSPSTGNAQTPVHPEAVNAPLFASILEQLDEEQRYVVLNLGPARGGTIGLFSRFRCRLEIADIVPAIARLNQVVDDELLPQAIEAALPARHSEPADLILCWDLLNYLQRPALSALMANVAGRARKGAMVHALISYSSKDMTREPGDFVPVDDQRLIKRNTHGEMCPAPRYSPEDLSHCLPDYRIERGRLLRNGMQEFLFRL